MRDHSTLLVNHSHLSFFFQYYADPRDLHSFPTRRSSDLTSPTRSGLNCATRRARRWSSPVARRRSEEHTSELQSLRHLVCRLLLEKKKTQRLTPQSTISHISITRTSMRPIPSTYPGSYSR